MKPLPRDRRQELAADLSGFTPAEIRCLADLAKGRLRRFPKGYALYNVLGEQIADTHAARVVWGLHAKGLVKLVVIVAAAGECRIAALSPGDGTAAWVARSAVSVARTWARAS